jgi:hypothetical protein
LSESMWSLTSPRAGRASGAEKLRSPTRNDFFNSIDPQRTSTCATGDQMVKTIVRGEEKPNPHSKNRWFVIKPSSGVRLLTGKKQPYSGIRRRL